jgi:hypothetical protein
MRRTLSGMIVVRATSSLWPIQTMMMYSSKAQLGCPTTKQKKREFIMANTVKENREGFTSREFDKTKEARCALDLVSYPSRKDFMNMIRSNMIKNCPVSPIDITNARTFLVLTLQQ